MTTMLFDHQAIPRPDQAMAFITNMLEASIEYSIIAMDLIGKILSRNEGARLNFGYAAEKQLQRKNEELTRGLHLQRAQLELCAYLERALQEDQPRSTMVHEIFERALSAGCLGRGLLYLLDPSGSLSLVAAIGEAAPAAADFYGELPRLQDAMRSETPIAIPSLLAPWASDAALLERAGCAALIVAPLIAAGKPLGLMVLFSDGESNLAPFASTAASQIAQAIGLADALAQARRRDQYLRRVFQVVPDALFLLDGQGDVALANPAAEALLADREAAEALFRAVRQGRPIRAEELCFPASDGHQRFFAVTAIPFSEADGDGLVVACADITHRRAQEESIRKLNTILDQSPAMVVVTDAQVRVEYVNQRCVDVMGYSRDELLGQDATTWGAAANPDLTEEILGALARHGEWRGEFQIRRKDGTVYREAAIISAYRDENGACTNFIKVAADVTARREAERLEAEARELQRINELKDEFLRSLSHELRNPLNNLVSALDRARKTEMPSGSPVLRRMVEIAVNNATRLDRLVSDLLDHERFKLGKFSIEYGLCDASDLARETVEGMELLARQSEVRLAFSGFPAMIRGDRIRLIQVLANLLDNAIKYSRPGGTVQVTVESDNLKVTIRVADEGCGIPTEMLETIFDRYRQVESPGVARWSGLGLGLSISRYLVEQHGGRIWAESELGAGTVIVVELPAAVKEAA